MLLATFSGQDGVRKPGVVRNGRVYELPFPDMQAVIQAGVEEASHKASSTPIHIAHVTFHAPLRPTTLRDGYAFEQHVKAANEIRGRDVPKEWYKFPVFYFTNPNSIYGPNEEIPYPRYTNELDYELEIAAIIGKGGRDIKPQDAPQHIFGFTIFNDWSARDIQREEMVVGLGPAKGKDFASSLGPYIITIDELAEHATDRPGVFDMLMYARINGQERSRANMKELYWSFGDIIARASEGVDLQPGDVIGSGTAGTGCLLELTRRQGPWLQPGNVVELEIEGIGVLRNQVGRRPTDG